MSLGQQLDDRWQRNFEARQRRVALKERAIDHMGGKCQKCGYDRCPEALDFHHLDPREKDFTISSRLGWEAVVEELKKCVLLCANCHREAHAGWHPDLLTLDDEGGDRGEDLFTYEDDADTDVEATACLLEE